MRKWVGLALLMMAASFATRARADLVVSVNDGHTILVDGVAVVSPSLVPDTLSVLDVTDYPPTLRDTIDMPASVIGPPTAIAIARDESFAIATSATKRDPATPGGIGPDDRVSVIDLTTRPPTIVQTIAAGAGATTVRIAPDGKTVLVVNRAAGSVSVFGLSEHHLTHRQTIAIGPGTLPSGLAFTADGKAALLTRYGDSAIEVLRMGDTVTREPRLITAGVGPYTIDVSPDGAWAAVGNMGRGDGDIDTVSLIDLSSMPFRTTQTLAVGRSPEGVRWSPDGRYLAVALQNGTTEPSASPFASERGVLVMLGFEGKTLRRVADIPIGRWTQGIAFSRDGRTVMVQAMVEHVIQVFRWDGDKLFPANPIDTVAGPAAIATSW